MDGCWSDGKKAGRPRRATICTESLKVNSFSLIHLISNNGRRTHVLSGSNHGAHNDSTQKDICINDLCWHIHKNSNIICCCDASDIRI